MDDFDIYFSDLNKKTQKRLMVAFGILDPREMNWDLDILPLASIPLPADDDGE